MPKCEAKLLFHTPLENLARAIRVSRSSYSRLDSLGDKLGKNDKNLIEKCLSSDETSVFEHLVYQFHLKFPRFVLQQLSRHRIGISPTVKSTRYTLKEISEAEEDIEAMANFLYETGHEFVDRMNMAALWNIRIYYYSTNKTENDIAKIMLPEAFMSEGIYTINARAFIHLYNLRSSEKVHQPFKELVIKMFDEIPEEHKFIFIQSFNNN